MKWKHIGSSYQPIGTFHLWNVWTNFQDVNVAGWHYIEQGYTRLGDEAVGWMKGGSILGRSG